MGARVDPAPRLAGAIIAGGRGTRLGNAAKGLLDVGGTRMIDRVAAALEPIVDRLFVVSDAPDAAAWLPRSRVLKDRLLGGGSAAGIHAALVRAGGPVLCVAWDMPFVTTSALRALVAKTGGREDGKTGVISISAAAPISADGNIEALCAWYAPKCVPMISEAWGNGDRRARTIFARVSSILVPAAELAGEADATRTFFNVNTPDDLARARAMATDDDTARSR